MDIISTHFYLATMQIIVIDVLLGGDNAVVIAMACRKLPEEQRNKGIMWGAVGAIGLRILLIFFALQMLALPYLKVVGGVLLLWIGIKLLQPENDDGHNSLSGPTHLIGAIRTIIVADAVMSMDNVVAVAGAAKGELGLVVFGILISVPIIVWGSKFVLKLMDRFPVVISFGAALLGWIAGEMLITDKILRPYFQGLPDWSHYFASVTGAVMVVVIGKMMAARSAESGKPFIDLAVPEIAEESLTSEQQ